MLQPMALPHGACSLASRSRCAALKMSLSIKTVSFRDSKTPCSINRISNEQLQDTGVAGQNAAAEIIFFTPLTPAFLCCPNPTFPHWGLSCPPSPTTTLPHCVFSTLHRWALSAHQFSSSVSSFMLHCDPPPADDQQFEGRHPALVSSTDRYYFRSLWALLVSLDRILLCSHISWPNRAVVPCKPLSALTPSQPLQSFAAALPACTEKVQKGKIKGKNIIMPNPVIPQNMSNPQGGIQPK